MSDFNIKANLYGKSLTNINHADFVIAKMLSKIEKEGLADKTLCDTVWKNMHTIDSDKSVYVYSGRGQDFVDVRINRTIGVMIKEFANLGVKSFDFENKIRTCFAESMASYEKYMKLKNTYVMDENNNAKSANMDAYFASIVPVVKYRKANQPVYNVPWDVRANLRPNVEDGYYGYATLDDKRNIQVKNVFTNEELHDKLQEANERFAETVNKFGEFSTMVSNANFRLSVNAMNGILPSVSEIEYASDIINYLNENNLTYTISSGNDVISANVKSGESKIKLILFNNRRGYISNIGYMNNHAIRLTKNEGLKVASYSAADMKDESSTRKNAIVSPTREQLKGIMDYLFNKSTTYHGNQIGDTEHGSTFMFKSTEPVLYFDTEVDSDGTEYTYAIDFKGPGDAKDDSKKLYNYSDVKNFYNTDKANEFIDNAVLEFKSEIKKIYEDESNADPDVLDKMLLIHNIVRTINDDLSEEDTKEIVANIMLHGKSINDIVANVNSYKTVESLYSEDEYNLSNIVSVISNARFQQSRDLFDSLCNAFKCVDFDFNHLNTDDDDELARRAMNRFIEYDEDSSFTVIDSDASNIGFPDDFSKQKQEYFKKVAGYINDSLTSLGYKDVSVSFDKNGVAKYSGMIHRTYYNKKGSADAMLDWLKREETPVSGTLGQFFAPDDEYGFIQTNFSYGAKNVMFVPGYTATVVRDCSHGDSLLQRTRLKSFDINMREHIHTALVGAHMDADSKRMEAGSDAITISSPSAMSHIYSDMYGTRCDMTYSPEALLDAWKNNKLGFDENSPEYAEYKESIKAKFKTLGSRFKYAKVFNEQGNYKNKLDDRYLDSYIGSLINMSEEDMQNPKSIREMNKHCLGFCSLYATGNGVNEGVVRYLCEGSFVNDDGVIIPSLSEDVIAENHLDSKEKIEDFYLNHCFDKGGHLDESVLNTADDTAIFKHNYFRHFKHNAVDRNIMSLNNILTAHNVAPSAKVMYSTFHGDTLDDGITISATFANKYQVYDKDTGKLRPLKVGDKLSDFNGNKGVISKIVLKPEETLEYPDGTVFKGHEHYGSLIPHMRGKMSEVDKRIVKVFRENPNLECVFAPYSPMGRANAGTLLYATEKAGIEDGKLDGQTVKGLIGSQPIMVTDMDVDKKTHYSKTFSVSLSDEEDEALNGRETVFSDEEYDGRNASGQLLWNLQSLGLTETAKELYGKNNKAFKNLQNYCAVIGIDIDDEGHISRIDKPYGNLVRVDFDKLSKEYDSEQEGQKKTANVLIEKLIASTSKNDKTSLLIPYEYGENLTFPDGTPMPTYEDESGKYVAMPMLDVHKLSFEFDAHDEFANKYKSILKWIANGEFIGKDPGKRDYMKYQKSTVNQKVIAINKALTADVVQNKIGCGKHSIFAKVFKCAQKKSATAPIIANSNLDLNDVGMSRDMMRSLGVKEGDEILILRDPQLHDCNISYFRVREMIGVTGVAVNPLSAKRFDGDFDGDTVGLIALQTEAARRECHNLLALQHNLLNKCVGRDGDEKTGDACTHPLGVNTDLDIKSVIYREKMRSNDGKSELETKFAEIEKTIQDNYGRCDDETFAKLNEVVHSAFDRPTGQQYVRLGDMKDLGEDLWQIVASGAKGNAKKLKVFYDYMGVPTKEDVDTKTGSVKVVPDTDRIGMALSEGNPHKYDMSNEDYLKKCEGICIALAAKADGTGIAGYRSQRGMLALRNVCPTSVLEITYPITQGLLQAKHDPDDAKLKLSIVAGVLPSVMNAESFDVKGRNNFDRNYLYNGPNKPVSEWITPMRDEKDRAIPISTSSEPITADEFKFNYMEAMCALMGEGSAESIAERKAFAKENGVPYVAALRHFCDTKGIMNVNALDKITEALTYRKDNKEYIIGIDEYADKYADPVSAMVYGINIKANPSKEVRVKQTKEQRNVSNLYSFADNKSSLFDNTCGKMAMPDVVRNLVTDEVTKSRVIDVVDTEIKDEPKKSSFQFGNMDKEEKTKITRKLNAYSKRSDADLHALTRDCYRESSKNASKSVSDVSVESDTDSSKDSDVSYKA